MPAPIMPWAPSNIPGEIQNELNRRKVNRAFNFINNSSPVWGKNGEFDTYKGPMVSWVRLCSNSAGHPIVPVHLDSNGNPICDKQRFILYSGKGFYDTYGFTPPKNVGGASKQIIGYMPGSSFSGDSGEPHIIENSLKAPSGETSNYPIHVPAPEISRIEVTVQKELLRRVQVEWVCFSWKQLEYMTPYFLVPGITCMIEWGWNHFNPTSLVNLSDTSKMRRLWDNAYPLYTDNIINSNGNYDVVYGIISNFNWSVEGNKIICTTEITSKDRLYSGIAKDYGLSVVNNDPINTDKSNKIVQSIRDFMKKDATFITLKTLTTDSVLLSSIHSTISSKPLTPSQILTLDPSLTTNMSPELSVWYNILNTLLTPSSGVTGSLANQQIGMRTPWAFGIFAGRPDDSYITKEKFGKPAAGDFDSNIINNDPKNLWMNMGMVVSVLNYFSKVPSGTTTGGKSNVAFQVDIQNSVIAGHPNLISCDRRVLIPNYNAPKFLYGSVGTTNNIALKGISSPDPSTPYSYQALRPTNPGLIINNTSSITPDQQVSQIFYQQGKCYRDNLDVIINYNRYRYDLSMPITVPQTYSFPAQVDVLLPETPNNLSPNKLEKDYSGLLSNVYISFDVLKDAVEDENNASYPDIYKSILQVLMDSVDGFWDLAVVEAGDGVMTITDKKYISKYALDQQSDSVYSFDYMDADSIIKGLKFRPVLSDAQATRTIYGSVNNKSSKYQYIDKNDLLDYKFRDAVIGTQEDKSQDNLQYDDSAKEQYRDILENFQTINSKPDDGTLQMSLNQNHNGRSNAPNTPPNATSAFREYVKLVMGFEGGQQLLRLLLADNDYDNNPRYCAVQPGIILELTLQGIGGLRTFQYFLVKNLPEPYSDRNIIFRITDVHQTLEAGNWETTIRAQPLPLRGYIKNKLKGPYINNPKQGSTKIINGWLPDSLS